MPSVKAAAAIAASLRRLYVGEVEVNYYDVSDPEVAEAHAEVLAMLAADRAPLPVVLLDGTILFAGAVNPLRVVAAVAEARQRLVAPG